MALPENILSTVPIKGKYLYPDNLDSSALISYELGGIGLNNPSKGLQYQVWTCEYISGRVRLSAPNQVSSIDIFEAPDITELSLAFDQNMRPFIAYMQADTAKFYWYDTLTAQAIHTDLPAGSICPCACLDDKRSMQVSASDIILAYIRNRTLYMRRQRDRYGVEYSLATPIDAKLLKIGMTNKNRLQFKLLPDV